jgi:hypothetical protein
MKVTLLKKVRRRFSITYHPQGLFGKTNVPTVAFKDAKNGLNNRHMEITSIDEYGPDEVKRAHQVFRNRIIDILIVEGHGVAKRKRAEKKIVKLFYK